jgi:hypothetical protein
MDAKRLAFWVAPELIAGPWTVERMDQALHRLAEEWGAELAGLAKRLAAAFLEPPAEIRSLADFLRTDPVAAPILERARIRILMRREAMGERPQPLKAIPFPDITSEAALAAWLGLELPRLQWLADVSGRNRRHVPGPLRTYRFRWIAKRGAGALSEVPGARLLEIPKSELKEMQRRILRGILNLLPLHEAVHGFRAGRSIATNAAAHCGKPAIFHFDLADFFHTVPAGRVFHIFRTLGYPRRVAWMLMGLCTTLTPHDVWECRPGAQPGADFERRQRLFTRHLPQGAPTSPALANFAALGLDRRLAGLAKKLGAVYTRYADDLNFSGGAELAKARRPLEILVGSICLEEGFTPNFKKTRLMRAGRRQIVTGVIVNAHPNIQRAQYDRLKAILTNCARHGPAAQNRQNLPDFRRHLTGKVAHVASVHPKRGAKLQRILNQIDWNAAASTGE